jgi:phosphate transport system permease protein
MTQAPLRAQRDRLGTALTWLCGGSLAMSLLLVAGMLALLAVHGLGFFWQKPLLEIELDDGAVWLGEVHDRAESRTTEGGTEIRIKIGNRDVTGFDFLWIDETRIIRRGHPGDALLFERLEWGNFYGRMLAIRSGERVLARGPQAAWRAFPELHAAKRRELAAVRDFEAGPLGEVNRELEQLELTRRRAHLELDGPALGAELARIEAAAAGARARYAELAGRLERMRRDLERETLILATAAGARREIRLGQVVRAVRPNELTTGERVGLYLSRLWEFVYEEPRESNTEGGVFPAIFGTVMMVFLMTLFVTPLGVVAAVYLREYARQGPAVRAVRIAVNNLAGVPSIVFGVFGLGFFVYLVGGSIDRLFYPEALPTPTYGTGGILWASLTLALLTVPVVIVATEESLAAVPRAMREGSLALGATHLETTWRVVVPAAGPGILTGMILSMARAAGEVAPLMIVGMVKLAPALPIDHHPPFVHLERKFMHLGFHIYDIGFQSPNVEATLPLVFATSLLLVLVVTSMNLGAIALRNRLRAKYASSAV